MVKKAGRSVTHPGRPGKNPRRSIIRQTRPTGYHRFIKDKLPDGGFSNV